MKNPLDSLKVRGWMLPALIFVLLAAGSLTARSIFLHFDTPTQHAGALDFVRGCWGFTSHKPMIMFLLAIPFAVFGANPVWELVLLTVLGTATVAAVWDILRRVTGSTRWALIGALWFASLPAVLFDLRIHMGYPLAFFTFAVWMHLQRRYGWAGALLAVGSLTHGSLLLPVALWGLSTFAFDRDTRRWSALWRLAAGFLAVWLSVEALRFLYVGDPLGWFKGVVIGEMLRQNNSYAAGGLTYVLELLAVANGWPNVILLLLGWLYPLLRRPRVPLVDAIAATGWGLIAFFMLRAIRNQQVLARLYVTAYPLLVITAVVTIRRGARWLAGRVGTPIPWERLIASAGMLALSVGLIFNTLLVGAASVSGYQAAGEAVRRAAAEGRPVRWYGNYHVALFYSRLYQAELYTNNVEIQPAEVMGDTQAVLIFELNQQNFAEVVDQLESRGWDESGAYQKTVVEHYPPSQNRQTEGFLNRDRLAELRRQLAGDLAGKPSELAIWWPTQPSGQFAPPEEGIHYPGTGCISRPIYGGGTKHFYQILWENLLERLPFSGAWVTPLQPATLTRGRRG